MDGPDLAMDPMSCFRSSFEKVGLVQGMLYLSSLHQLDSLLMKGKSVDCLPLLKMFVA